jgi:hypothetical protein
MKDRWLENNVNLNALSAAIQRFFAESGFESGLVETVNGYRIEALTKKISVGVQLKISVEIIGKPNDFTVDFTTDKKRKGILSPLMVIGYVTTSFGGGSFLLRDAKLRDALDRLERLFWEYVDKQVDELTNSDSR